MPPVENSFVPMAVRDLIMCLEINYTPCGSRHIFMDLVTGGQLVVALRLIDNYGNLMKTGSWR